MKNETTLCRICGKPHGLSIHDAGSDREYERMCIPCFDKYIEPLLLCEGKTIENIKNNERRCSIAFKDGTRLEIHINDFDKLDFSFDDNFPEPTIQLQDGTWVDL